MISYALYSLRDAALPNYCDVPACFGKRERYPCVTVDVPVDFVGPESSIRFGTSSFPTLVSVPETAMHENCGSIFREDDVGFAGEIASMKSKPEPGPVQGATNDQLWLRIFCTDARHQLRSRLGGHRIGHRRDIIARIARRHV